MKDTLTLWNAQLADLEQSITQYQNAIDSKKQQLMRMDKHIMELQGIIKDPKCSKGYARLRTTCCPSFMGRIKSASFTGCCLQNI